MITNRIKLAKDFKISPIVQGHWRIDAWKFSNQDLLKHTEQCIELGINTFDHADIYGDYSCEKLFGNALKLKKGLRKEIQIITKCGIKLLSNKFPSREIHYYDYSYEHIIESVENSLKNLDTDYIDLLLLHRPAPFFNPKEVAKAFTYLKAKGMVINFGVSNFTPIQFAMLSQFTDEKLITNQVEISPYCLEHFENGNIDFFLKESINPMAWSPLSGGDFLNKNTAKNKRIIKALTEVANELQIDTIEKVIYCWLLKHPVNIIPIVGTSKIERLKYAIEALHIQMSLEQWYKIYKAATGVELP